MKTLDMYYKVIKSSKPPLKIGQELMIYALKRLNINELQLDDKNEFQMEMLDYIRSIPQIKISVK